MLVTKKDMERLIRQWPMGGNLEAQKAIVRIFNPYGTGEWYLINADPNDTDYIWGIVKLYETEVGRISLSELTRLKIGRHKLPLERDKFYTPENAAELLKRLKNQ